MKKKDFIRYFRRKNYEYHGKYRDTFGVNWWIYYNPESAKDELVYLNNIGACWVGLLPKPTFGINIISFHEEDE